MKSVYFFYFTYFFYSGMALHGGIGVIHNNMVAETQADCVRKVKRYKNGFILKPKTLGPNHLVSDVDMIKDTYGYSGKFVTH